MQEFDRVTAGREDVGVGRRGLFRQVNIGIVSRTASDGRRQFFGRLIGRIGAGSESTENGEKSNSLPGRLTGVDHGSGR